MDAATINSYLDKVDPAGPPSNCAVNIRNATTTSREVVIEYAGVHFEYVADKERGGADYLAGPVKVDLNAGEGTTFRSSDPRKQVTKAIVGVKVRFGQIGGLATKEFKYTLVVDAPARSLLIELNVDFRAMPHAATSPSDAGKWYELYLQP